MITPLAPIITSIFSPLIALLIAVFTFQFVINRRKLNLSWVLAFTLPLALIVSSREIPALPSDDLDDYHGFYTAVQTMGLNELLIFSRFEPTLFIVYKSLGGMELSERGLLFVHAFLCALVYVFAAISLCRRLCLPNAVFCVTLFFFPYELVSNTPRLVFAASLFIIFIEVRSSWRYCFLILALLSHKFIYFLFFMYLASIVFCRYRLLVTIAPVFLSFSIVLLPHVIHLPLFNRARYYFLVAEAGSYSSKYLVFAVPFFIALWVKSVAEDVLPQVVFFYTLCLVAFAVSPYGALGDRMGQPVWMPFVCFLFLIAHYRKEFVAQVSLLILVIGLILIRLLVFSAYEGHDPFSEYEFLSLYPIKLLYGYLVAPL